MKTIRLLCIVLLLIIQITATFAATYERKTRFSDSWFFPRAHPTAPRIERITIPGGCFIMGEDGDSQRPDIAPHLQICLDDFEISRDEITFGQFQAFVDAGGYRDKEKNGYWSTEELEWHQRLSDWGQAMNAPKYKIGDTHASLGRAIAASDPVFGISHMEAMAYSRFVGGFLPTEAQWEKAAGWGPDFTSPRRYPSGSEPRSLPPKPLSAEELREYGDLSGYGVVGMEGSLREWVRDMYDPEFPAQLQSRAQGGAIRNPYNLQALRQDMVEEYWQINPTYWGRFEPYWVPRGGSYKFSDRLKARCSTRSLWGYKAGQSTQKFVPLNMNTWRSISWLDKGTFDDIGFRVVWEQPSPPAFKPAEREERPGAAVRIPAGKYRIGSSYGLVTDTWAAREEKPEFDYTLDHDIWIGKYEVTYFEYIQFLEKGGYRNYNNWLTGETSNSNDRGLNYLGVVGMEAFMTNFPIGERRPLIGAGGGSAWPTGVRTVLWKGPRMSHLLAEYNKTVHIPGYDHPLVGVSWFEALAYSHFVGGRLPNEAEWEIAAGFDPGNRHRYQYPWGNLDTYPASNNLSNSAIDRRYPGSQTSPVGMYPDGKSGLGCLDIAGNAFEWASNTFYPGVDYAVNLPIGTGCFIKKYMNFDFYTRGIRGGCFNFTIPSNAAHTQRARTRGIDGAELFKHWNYGVRVAWDRDPSTLRSAQEVRPVYLNGANSPDKPFIEETFNPPPGGKSTSELAWTGASASDKKRVSGVIDTPGKEIWHKVSAPLGSMLEIDLDANGGADDWDISDATLLSRKSPLDAVIEIWEPGHGSFPLAIVDDEFQWVHETNTGMDRYDYFLDPPVFRYPLPAEGFVWVKVRAYSWPQEGSQTGKSAAERSWTGVDFTYDLNVALVGETREPTVIPMTIAPTATSTSTPRPTSTSSPTPSPSETPTPTPKPGRIYDLNQDGLINHADLALLLDIFKSKSMSLSEVIYEMSLFWYQ